MPVLQPVELWQATGRDVAYGPELYRLRDRRERGFVLAPTHGGWSPASRRPSPAATATCRPPCSRSRPRCATSPARGPGCSACASSS